MHKLLIPWSQSKHSTLWKLLIHFKKKIKTWKNNNKTIIKCSWKQDQYISVEFGAYKTVGITEIYSGFLSRQKKLNKKLFLLPIKFLKILLPDIWVRKYTMNYFYTSSGRFLSISQFSHLLLLSVERKQLLAES